MTSTIDAITIDCRNPFQLARFWAEVLGFIDDPSNPNGPDDPEALLIDPRGLHPSLLFLPVPEGKTTKNRVHLDLTPDVLREIEIERVLGLGARLVEDHRRPDGTGWAVLADLEDNEFCILRSAAERPESLPMDTGERAFPPVRTAGERVVLEELLDWYRAGVIAKVDGLAQHRATARPLASSTSVAGLVKHLALVEESWMIERFEGERPSDWWADADWAADRDWEFHSVSDEPIELQVERYEAAVARSREIAGSHELDDLAAAAEGHDFTLRFVLMHLLEETARHLGHLDVLRELLDGTTGE